MVTIVLENIKNLNVSLQVGDMIYGQRIFPVSVDIPKNLQGGYINSGYGETGTPNAMGVLRRISVAPYPGTTVVLDIDETVLLNPYTPPATNGVLDRPHFIMFSKYDQSIGDVIGYYAKARFENDSIEKAEIFSVGSEVIINSK